MGSRIANESKQGVDLCSLEADMAFFEARLSLAGRHPDTVYQQAQIKTYQTLGVLLGDQLKSLQSSLPNDGSSAAA